MGLSGHHADRALDQRAGIEGDVLQVQPSGVEPGEIQDVLDQRGQMLARLMDDPRVFALFRVQVHVAQQAGGADDAVHRRPDLMAHDREEFGARASSGLGGVPRGGEVVLGAFAFGDVGEGAHRAAIRQERGADLQHRAVGPGALVEWQIGVEAAAVDHFGDRPAVVKFRPELGVGFLPVDQVIEAHARTGDGQGQFQQFRDTPVHHPHAPVAVDHQDALTDVFHRHHQIGLEPRQPVAVQDHARADQDDDHGKERARQQRVLALPFIAGEHRFPANANGDDERIAGDSPVTDDRLAIDHRSGAVELEQGRFAGWPYQVQMLWILQRLADHRGFGLSGANDAVLADQQREAFPHARGFPESAKHLWFERGGRDAREAAIQTADTPCQLDDHLSGDDADHGFADEQAILRRRHMDLKMLPAGDVDPPRPNVGDAGRHGGPRRVDDRQPHADPAQNGLVAQPRAHGEMVRIVQIRIPRVQQRLIQHRDRAAHGFLEGPREGGGPGLAVLKRALVLLVKAQPDGAPDHAQYA